MDKDEIVFKSLMNGLTYFNLIESGKEKEAVKIWEQQEILIFDEDNWIKFDGNEKLFTKMAKRNCKIMFDDGTICNYNDEHPVAIITHFRIK